MIFYDEILGELTWDETIEGYTGTITIDGLPVEIFLLLMNEENKYQFLEYARQQIAWIKENTQIAKLYASQKLLEIKNEAWLEEDEPPITEEEFINQLNLTSIGIYLGGDASIGFEASEALFWGHDVSVELDSSGNFQDASF
jgi:hypothetical protein